MKRRALSIEQPNFSHNAVTRAWIAQLCFKPSITLDLNINCGALIAHDDPSICRRDQRDLITDRGQEQCGADAR